MCAGMSISTLFTVAKKLKTLKCPFVGADSINYGYSHSIKWYRPMKGSDPQLLVANLLSVCNNSE